MHVTVTGRNLDVPVDLRERAIQELGAIDRLLGGRRNGHRAMEIVFTTSRNPRIADPIACDVTVHDRGGAIHVTGTAADLGSAIDVARNKLQALARTRKGKLRRRARAPHRGDVADQRVPVVM